MTRKGLFLLFAVLSIGIGIYPVIYLFLDSSSFGLLQSKSDEVLTDRFWNMAFYTHIVFGGIALLTGWSQFIAKWRRGRVKLHRTLGLIYVVAVVLSGTAAVNIAFQATGGLIPALGFLLLGIFWLYTTLRAFLTIRAGEISKHQVFMTFSFAACFAAVTLRIWLPVLSSLTGDFVTAYKIVAWLCWIPNLLVAWFILRRDPTLVKPVSLI